MKTTITISLETWNKLKALKTRPSESYDEIISKLVEENKWEENKW